MHRLGVTRRLALRYASSLALFLAATLGGCGVGANAGKGTSGRSKDRASTGGSQGAGYADRCVAPTDASLSTTFRAVSGDKETPWRAVAKLVLSGGEVCSAVLVAPRKLLTAAHCFEDGRTAQSVAFQDSSANEDEPASAPLPEAVRLHPHYAASLARGERLSTHPTLASVDVAIVTLSSDVLDRDPIPLANEAEVSSLPAGRLVSLVGFGESGLKRFAQSHVGRVVKKEDASSRGFENLVVLDSRTGTGACPGDSGGGVFLKINGAYALVGVVSGVNDILYPGFPVNSCDRCPQGLGIVAVAAAHGRFLSD